MKRQHLLLLMLLLLLAGSIAYSVLFSPRQERVAPATATAQPARAQQPRPGNAAPGSGVRLRSDLLDEAPRRFTGVKRDLFYAAPIVVPPPVTVAVVVPPPLVPEIPPPPPPPTAQELMRIELGRFTFLGYLEKAGRKTIFLRAEGGEPFVVKLGDRFGHNRQFLVESLAPTRMEIRAGDDPQLYPIILQEQGALSSVDSAGWVPVVAPSGASSNQQRSAPQTFPPPGMRDPRARSPRPFGVQRPNEPLTEEPEVETPMPPEVEPASGENDPMQPEGQTNASEE